MAALLSFAFVPEGFAQGGDSSTESVLYLKEDAQVYDIGPYFYVTKDSQKKLSYKDIYESHVAGKRGFGVRGDALLLGSTSVPRWVVFSVENKSWTDEWVLSFGDRMQGRTGMVKRIFLYEHSSRKKFIDNISPSKNPFLAKENEIGTSVNVRLPRGQKALFVLFVEPMPGAPVALPMQFVARDFYDARAKSIFRADNAIGFFFVAMIGFLASFIFTARLYPCFFLIFYYALQCGLFYFKGNIIHAGDEFTNEISGLLLLAAAIAGLLATRSFLEVGKLQLAQGRVATAFIIGLILTGIVATFIIPDQTIAKPFVIYGTSLASLCFLMLLSLAQAYNGRVGSYLFAGGWISASGGLLMTCAALLNILPANTVFLPMYWYALVPQGILFAVAIISIALDFERTEKTEYAEQKAENESIAEIKQNKDAAENVRLRRLIEHERQVMNELRDREVQQNEEMRKARDEADEANRAKSAFLAVVSHEIRTPMSGILGMVRLLLETDLSKDQNDYAKTIQDSSNAMLSLLNDILDFEKIESGKMDLEYVDFDLHRLINGISTLMSGHAATKGVYLNIEMESDIPRYVIGDSVRLRQVLLNLTGNAIKFTTQGGVTLRVKKAAGSSTAAGGVYKIYFGIQDTGVGISKDAQKNLFSPFAQADSSVTRKFGGTGLGLAISQRLIEAMGGKIQIDSIEGEGSTFYFTVMFEEGSAEAAEDSSTKPLRMQKSEKSLKILVVEDNEVNQRLLKEFVNRMGHETILAGTAEIALELIQGNSFDMVLMDVELPGLSGMGATKAIRAMDDRQKAMLPVIALTGNVRSEDVRQCYAANMNGHLAKPVDPKRLKQMIDKVISNTLDNPVIIEARTEQSYTRVNRLDKESIATRVKSKVEDGQVANEEDAGASDDSQTENDVGADLSSHDKEEKAEHEPTAQVERMPKSTEKFAAGDAFDEIAPIRRLALQAQEMAFESSDEDSPFHLLPQDKEEKGVGADSKGLIFDQDSLTLLRGRMDEALFNELIDDLFTKADEIIDSIRGHVQLNRVSEVRVRAHELKGMAGNYGLKELSSIAADIELAAKDGRIATVQDLHKNLPGANIRAREAIDQWMAEN